MTMISREIKRSKLHRSCNHAFTADPIRDPSDKRVILRSRMVEWAGKRTYQLQHCKLCGVGKLIR